MAGTSPAMTNSEGCVSLLVRRARPFGESRKRIFRFSRARLGVTGIRFDRRRL
jgi:hypothetical protein